MDTTALTAREVDVAAALATGATNKAVARRLGVSVKTVEFHVTNVFRKLRVATRSELTQVWLRSDIGGAMESGGWSAAVALVGRDDALVALAEMLVTRRIVTVVGAGGVGKTALARAVVPRVSESFVDGCRFVDLTTARCAEEVPVAAAASLGLRLSMTAPTAGDVARALGSRRCLIILDNCEHVLEGAASFSTSVVATSRHAVVLATSRERLDVSGECVVRLPPLAWEGDDGEAAAVTLFRQRARDVGHGTVGFGSVLADLCRRLDGLPLAIELAAARCSTMTVVEIGDALVDWPTLLVRRRAGAGRHGSLHSTIMWSYDLLAPSERKVLAALSVHRGDFDLDAATAVANDAECDVPATVRSLVEQSMVVMAVDGPHARYRLLDTIRAVVDGRLHPDERRIAQLQHLAHYSDVARAADVGLRGAQELSWHLRIEVEWHNFRTAMDTAINHGRFEAAGDLIRHLLWWAHSRSRLELGGWAQRALTMPCASSHEDRLIVSCAALEAALASGDRAAARRLQREIRDQPGYDREVWVPMLDWFDLDLDATTATSADLEHRATQAGDQFLQLGGQLLRVLWQMWDQPLSEHDDVSRRQVEQIDETANRIGNPGTLAWSDHLSGVAHRRRDPVHAHRLLTRSIRRARGLGLDLLIQQSLTALARLDLEQHQPTAALAHLTHQLETRRTTGTHAELPIDLEICVAALDTLDQPAAAAECRHLAANLATTRRTDLSRDGARLIENILDLLRNLEPQRTPFTCPSD